MTERREGHPLPQVSAGDTVAFLLRVALPTFAKGLMIRRQRIVTLAARHELDARAVAELRRLQARYGDGPVRLRVPGRPQAVVLGAEDMTRILAGAPEPFSPATREKIATLGHFEPRASLISRGAERTVRRRFSDEVLESTSPHHSMANHFLAIVRDEASALAGEGAFDWSAYSSAWARAVRRIVLGDGARDDIALTEDLDALRRAGNWSFLRPRRQRLMRRYYTRLSERLEDAEAGSLAARIAALPPDRRDAPTAVPDQVTHWLFAFDAAALAGMRALALLATHPKAYARAREEPAGPANPFLRGTILDSLRLYPTTPVILREATQGVSLPGGTAEAGAHFIIFAPYFHRDDRLPEADRFVPEIWLPGGAADTRPYVPFSGGQAFCPGRHFVPMLAGEMVGSLVRAGDLHLTAGQSLDPDRPLPGTLDHTALSFRLVASARGHSQEAPKTALPQAES